MAKAIRMLLPITILSGIVLSSFLTSFATEVIDTVELTVPFACTMGGTGQTSHNASIKPGTYSGASGSDYEAGIGKTTLTTFCNDNNGFSVYAIGFTGDLYEGETHTKLIGQNTNLTISTKVYTSGDTDSNWSMKVTKVDNPASGDPITYNPDNMSIQNSFNSWHTVPDVYTKVAQYNSNTTDPATTDTTLGAKLETTYATYISSAQAADTYTGQVKYTMVHPYNAIPPTNISCNPNASTISEAVCMQDFAGPNGDQIDDTMTLEQQYTLIDKRDNKSYTITKLADGRVWMTQNLDLDLDSNVTYTNDDTDLGFNSKTGKYGPATWTPSTSTRSTNDTTWIGSNNTPESYDPGDLYWRDYTGETAAWREMFSTASRYMTSCGNGSCNDKEYALLTDDWKTFVDSCNHTSNDCDFVLLPSDPTGFYRQTILASLYAQMCISQGACDDSLYTALNDEWKAYIGSCDATFEVCDESLRPSDISSVNTATNGIQQYHLGNYYNWTTAVALNDSSDQTGSVYQSICPSGWTLPFGRDQDKLFIAYGRSSYTQTLSNNYTAYLEPMYYNLSGYVSSSDSLQGIGDHGYFWSSDAFNEEWAESASIGYDKKVYGNSINIYRGDGGSVRCIVRVWYGNNSM